MSILDFIIGSPLVYNILHPLAWYSFVHCIGTSYWLLLPIGNSHWLLTLDLTELEPSTLEQRSY